MLNVFMSQPCAPFALLVFVPFMLLLFKQSFRLDYLWAAFCILGAVFFVFRSA
ncbi:MAG: DMT family protein [Candidatus Saccharibacteria bacterium]|nr:DMT family protein [Moraxellaceae bacterium]